MPCLAPKGEVSPLQEPPTEGASDASEDSYRLNWRQTLRSKRDALQGKLAKRKQTLSIEQEIVLLESEIAMLSNLHITEVETLERQALRSRPSSSAHIGLDQDVHLKGFEAKRIQDKRIRSQKDSRPKRIRGLKGFET